jgi:hypothetical protein
MPTDCVAACWGPLDHCSGMATALPSAGSPVTLAPTHRFHPPADVHSLRYHGSTHGCPCTAQPNPCAVVTIIRCTMEEHGALSGCATCLQCRLPIKAFSWYTGGTARFTPRSRGTPSPLTVHNTVTTRQASGPDRILLRHRSPAKHCFWARHPFCRH